MNNRPDSDGTYFRFVGWLREDGEFSFDHGWETPRVTQPVRGTEGCRITLLDAQSQPLLNARAEIQSDTCDSVGGRMKSRRVIGYVPAHRDAAKLRLSVDGRTVHEREVAPSAPRIERVDATVSDGSLRVTWQASHAAPLRYWLGLADREGRRVKLVSDSQESEATFPLDALPLEGDCRVVVLASDGVRSSTATSEPISLPNKPVRVCILSPDGGRRYSPLHGMSLIGNATSPLGRLLDDEPLAWFVDGELVARGTRLHHLPALEAGTHVVELRYLNDSRSAARVEVLVERRTPLEEEWCRSLEANLREMRAGDESGHRFPDTVAAEGQHVSSQVTGP